MSEKKYYGNTKKTTEQFIEEAKKIHGNKFNYSKSEYKNAHTKVCIICPEHGEFFQSPISHLRGDKCPSCSGNKKLTSEQFIKKSNEIHNNKFDYSKVDYKNNSTKVCIICPEHGEFWMQPSNHLNGQGCPKCGRINAINKTIKWDYDKCFELAKTCQTKKEFREKSESAYNKSLKNKWLETFIWLKCSKFDIKGKIDSVYCYIFEDTKSVYVGRTLMREQNNRNKSHNTNNTSSVFKYSLKNNLQIPPMQILEENLTLEEGQVKENEWCEKFKNKGYNIINIAPTGKNIGSLGALSKKWTFNKCYQKALNYEFINDFKKNSETAYNVSLKNGWLKMFNWLKYKTNRWTEKTVEEEARKYTTLHEFKTLSAGAYDYAYRHNLIINFNWLKKGQTKPRKWSYNHCYKEAQKYEYLYDFIKKSNSAYKVSLKNEWLKDFNWLKYTHQRNRNVLQIDKNSNIILNEFISLKDASIQTGIDKRLICKCCKGQCQQSKGFKWAYKDEYDLKNNIKE